MKIKHYGLLSEVWDDGKIVFVGGESECEDYMSDYQIVGKNEYDEPITRQTLKKYFELIQNSFNWKNPVSKAVRNDITPHEEAMISQAVTFFTGSVVSWSYKDGKKWISFDGYYKAIGA